VDLAFSGQTGSDMTSDTDTTTKIRVESLDKSFNVDGYRQLVLDDIQLTVGEGEFVSIIGPSGCGKSTLLNIVAGLDSLLVR